MIEDFEACYRALRTRDARFDGRFFIGVVTTGIYCRPICPAPTPLARNVRFFACAAGAEAAGFRPCLRCRPETAPGTPTRPASLMVSRALALIAEGAIQVEGNRGLAGRLGVGARRLRRVFSRSLGASPRAVAHTRRVHFARKLIDETTLPMVEVAFGSGFESVRQFNDAIRKAFGKCPRDLRRSSSARLTPANGDALVLQLPYRQPLHWESLVRYFKKRAIPGVEEVVGQTYRRTIALGGTAGVLEVFPEGKKPQLLLRLHVAAHRHLARVVERVRLLFDLDADPLAICSQLQTDPLLGPLISNNPGLRVPGAWDGFELAVRAILGQQVTVKGASTLAGRIVEAFGTPLPRGPSGGLTHLFPAPKRLARARLEPLGMPRARARAIRSLAGAIHRGDLAFNTAGDPESFAEQLTRLPGIGAWTAAYIAMRVLREPDAFPASDLGLRKAASGGDKPLSTGELDRLAQAWRPWRAYAAIYLWHGNGQPNGQWENAHDPVLDS